MHGVAAASYSSSVRCVQQGAGSFRVLSVPRGPAHTPMNTFVKCAENQVWVDFFLSRPVGAVLDATRRGLPAWPKPQRNPTN